MRGVGYVLYTFLGLFQIAATIAGVQHWLGIHWIVASAIALVIAWTPIIGTVLGMVGAHSVWGWSWPSAFLLFLGPLFVIAAFAFGAAALERKARAG
jgi:hypothetical protein